MCNCLIVDDEKPARDEMKYLLERIDGMDMIIEASNGIEALKLCEKNDIDLVFLDIKMPQLSGLEVAEILMEKDDPPKIIFTTAYDEYAIEAFRVDAVDYILKPIDEEKLRESVQKKIFKNLDNHKIINNIKSKDKEVLNRITVYDKNKLIPINSSEIIYITVENKETIIYTEDSRYIVPNTLNKIMNKLDGKVFFRSHKSFIVNLEKIRYIEEWFNSTYNLKLKDVDEKIPVSRSNAKEFKCIMNMN